MVVRVLPAMSPDLSVSMAEVTAMSDSAFHKRFRSSYERGDEEEDEEMEESSDSNSVSEDAEDEGPTAEDKDPAAGDEGLAARDEGPGIGVESRGSDDDSRGLDDEGHSVESDGIGLGEEEEVVPEGQHQVVPVVGAAVSAPLGLGYGALRRRELALEEDQAAHTHHVDRPGGRYSYIDVPAYPPPAPPAETPPSPEWSSGLLPISPAPFVVPLPISSPMIPLTIPSHELSPALFERSLEHEQERVVVTFGELWRPVLALESWAEERRVRLELAEIVDSMRRGQEPRGDV
ncbi:hypothetical protein Tco_1280962 [Tanacetum coccineum]